MVLGFHDLMDEQERGPGPPSRSRTSSLAHLRKRSRWRLAAVSGAAFLALLGFETARLHNGHDPALARSTTGAASTQTSTQSQSQTQNPTTSSGSSSSGSSSSNDSSSSSGQSYYTPPSSDPPVTSSS
jgi:hypothetical protein